MEAVTMKFKNVLYGKYCTALLTRKPFWINKASSCKMNSQCETQDWYYIIEVLKNKFAIEFVNMVNGINIWCQENWKPKRMVNFTYYINDVTRINFVKHAAMNYYSAN